MAKIENKSMGGIPDFPSEAKEKASLGFILPEGKDLPAISGAARKSVIDPLSRENYAKINEVAKRLGQPLLSLSPSAALAFFLYDSKMETETAAFLRDIFLSIKP